MPNDYTYSGIRHWTPIQSFDLGLNGAGIGSGRDMLNLHNGNHILEFTDFVRPFYNSPLVLKRYYNNLCDVVGMFGEGWHCIWEMKMSESGNDRKFVDQTGAEWLFTTDGQGGFNRPAGLFADLTVNGDTYTITYLRDKTEIVFEKDKFGNYVLKYIENSVGVKHTVVTDDNEPEKVLSVTTTHTDGGDYLRKIEFAFDGNLVTTVTSDESEITFEYDQNDRLVKVTLPNGDSCEFAYYAAYKLSKFKDYNGNVTLYEYDGSNRLSKRTGACGAEHSLTYNANQTVVNDPRGKDWTHNFDGNGCRTSLVTPRSKTYSWTYNGDRLVLTYVIPGPITAVTNTYDGDGFILTTTDALNKQYGFTWDGNDLLTTITDPDTNTIGFTYNADRQVLTVTNQENETTEYAYDSYGALEKITDPKGHETIIENNGYGQATVVTDPLGGTVETTFDSANLVPVAITGKDGKTTSFAYDLLNRIIAKTYPNGDKLEYDWDGSRLLSITRREYSNGVAGDALDFTRYSHDGYNRVVSVETKNGGNTRYEFDETGQIKSVHGRDCQLREYTYDDDGNLTKVTINETEFEYNFEVDDRGWRTKITYPNDWYVDYTRNNRGQLTDILLKDDQNNSKHEISYSYDNLALVSSIIERDYEGGMIQKDFTRDDVGRVTVEDRNTLSGTWGTDYDLELDYDDNGNITRIHDIDGGGKDYNMEFDALNRMVRYFEETGEEKGIFSYNCQGLFLAKEVNGDITKFGYDAFSVLNQITQPNGDELDFNFDLLGRLKSYITDDRDSTFDYEGTKRLGDFDDEWKRYHWCRSQFLGYRDDTNTYYIVPDAEGSTKVIFTHAGNVVNRLDYDHLGYLRNKTTDPQVELLWKGKFYVIEINQYFLMSEFIYDPILGYSSVDKVSFIKTFIPIPLKNRHIYFSENQTMEMQIQPETRGYDPKALMPNRLTGEINPYCDEAHPVLIGYRDYGSNTAPCFLHTVDWSDGTTTHLPSRGGSRCLTRGEAELLGPII